MFFLTSHFLFFNFAIFSIQSLLLLLRCWHILIVMFTMSKVAFSCMVYSVLLCDCLLCLLSVFSLRITLHRPVFTHRGRLVSFPADCV